jgi:DNA-binding transcriptional MocR family regulator
MAWRGLEMLAQLAGGPKLTRELVDALGMTKAGVRDVCKRLAARGLMQSVEGLHGITEAGRAALAGGAELLTGPRKGSCAERYKNSTRAKAWRAFRIRRKASVEDLLPLLLPSDADKPGEKRARNDLTNYLAALTASGHLVQLPLRGGQARWLLARDTGPCAPAWHKARRTVTDANTGEVHRV